MSALLIPAFMTMTPCWFLLSPPKRFSRASSDHCAAEKTGLASPLNSFEKSTNVLLRIFKRRLEGSGVVLISVRLMLLGVMKPEKQGTNLERPSADPRCVQLLVLALLLLLPRRAWLCRLRVVPPNALSFFERTTAVWLVSSRHSYW